MNDIKVVRVLLDPAIRTVKVPGTRGLPGISAIISAMTVETLPAGSDATATMGGTPTNRTIHLGIPQGAPGVPWGPLDGGAPDTNYQGRAPFDEGGIL